MGKTSQRMRRKKTNISKLIPKIVHRTGEWLGETVGDKNFQKKFRGMKISSARNH
jgi:hypothetical protein